MFIGPNSQYIMKSKMWPQERFQHKKYSLIALMEKLRCNLDKNGSCRVLLIDLSKAFNCYVLIFLIST